MTGYTDTPNGTTDYLTIKYNANGDTLWTRTYNGAANGNDEALGIKLDASGNVYVTGRSQGVGAAYNMITIKYNSGGIQQWIGLHSGAAGSINIGYNIATDVFGSVYVIGGNSINGGVLVKYNSLGVAQWTITLPGNYQNMHLVMLNQNNELIVTGSGSVNHIYYLRAINPSNGSNIRTYNTNTSNYGYGLPIAMEFDGLNNIYITATRINQAVETTKFTYPGTLGQSYAWKQWTSGTSGAQLSGVGMKLDDNNNVYVTIKFFDGINFRFFVKKLSASGTQLWQNPASGQIGIEGTPVSMTLSHTGSLPDIYIAGFNALGDFKTVKYSNATGDTLWTKTYDCGNNGPDIATAMVTDNCDNIYITGTSNCNGTFKDVKTIKYAVAAAPAVTPNGPLTFCQGGSVTLAASAGNSYLWSNGATTPFITVNTSGNYTVTVTNAAGCPQVSLPTAVTVLPPPAATITPAGQATVCQGASTVLTAPPGNTYQWSNGATTQNITVTAGGSYWVTVTNAAGCMAVSPATSVVVQPAPVANVTTVGATTFCQGNSVMITASPAASYLWSNGATTQSITVSVSGNYTVTVTNQFGCSAVSVPVPVTVNPDPIANITPVGATTFCAGNSVELISSPAASYLWSNGATTPSITVSTSGSYTVTLTSAAGCTAVSASTDVTVNPAPVASITNTGPLSFCQGGSVVLTAGQANTYQWNTGPTSQSIIANTGGTYSVTVTNAAGCFAATAVTVTVTPVASLSLDPTHTDCGLTNGIVLTNISGGSPITGFLWNNGATTQHLTNLPGGTYSVTATDVNGCTVTAQTTVIGRVNPTVTLGPPIFITPGQQVVLVATATGSGLTYLWSTGATTPTINVNMPDTYSVTVTNSDGCSASDVVSVIVSTSENEVKHKITVFPNPATDVLHIKCEGSATVSIRLLNILGRQITEDRTPAPDGAVRTLQLDNVPAGTYLVEIIGEDFRKTVSFVKMGSR